MSDDQFTKLFKYMQTEFKAVRSEIATVNTKIDGVQGTLDALAKQILDLNQEHLMLAHKVDRVETWVQQIAQETGVKLKFN